MSVFNIDDIWEARNGRRARIVSTTQLGNFPIRAIWQDGPTSGTGSTFTKEGRWTFNGANSANDLVRFVCHEGDASHKDPMPEAQPEKSDAAFEALRYANTDEVTADVRCIFTPGETMMLEPPPAPSELHPDFIEPGYQPLAGILQRALDQAQAGKGKERHANGRAFLDQPIMEIGRMVGVGYQAGQSMKKIQEAVGMLRRDQPDRAIAELLGAINYVAAAILLIEESGNDD